MALWGFILFLHYRYHSWRQSNLQRHDDISGVHVDSVGVAGSAGSGSGPSGETPTTSPGTSVTGGPASSSEDGGSGRTSSGAGKRPKKLKRDISHRRDFIITLDVPPADPSSQPQPVSDVVGSSTSAPSPQIPVSIPQSTAATTTTTEQPPIQQTTTEHSEEEDEDDVEIVAIPSAIDGSAVISMTTSSPFELRNKGGGVAHPE